MANNTGKKYGGRQAGTPNKLTKELRDLLNDVLHQEVKYLPQHFSKLEPKDRIEHLVKLLSFVLPKPESNYVEKEGLFDSWPIYLPDDFKMNI